METRQPLLHRTSVLQTQASHVSPQPEYHRDFRLPLFVKEKQGAYAAAGIGEGTHEADCSPHQGEDLNWAHKSPGKA